ncbi:tape measure protein [Microbacterium oxydans]|nr:tape measure protein [Microbacterium oxydans]
MEEMGSIFNKAATQANGVQNDVISQLADRGIPIYQALADQMGVTAGEVFKMASEGKVDFETFSKAAEAAARHGRRRDGQDRSWRGEELPRRDGPHRCERARGASTARSVR